NPARTRHGPDFALPAHPSVFCSAATSRSAGADGAGALAEGASVAEAVAEAVAVAVATVPLPAGVESQPGAAPRTTTSAPVLPNQRSAIVMAPQLRTNAAFENRRGPASGPHPPSKGPGSGLVEHDFRAESSEAPRADPLHAQELLEPPEPADTL